jgi:hypothetical protein
VEAARLAEAEAEAGAGAEVEAALPGGRRGSLSSPAQWKRKPRAAAVPRPTAEPSAPSAPTPTRAGLRSASKPKLDAEETPPPPPPPPPPPAAEVGAEVAMPAPSGCEVEAPKAEASGAKKKKGKKGNKKGKRGR